MPRRRGRPKMPPLAMRLLRRRRLSWPAAAVVIALLLLAAVDRSGWLHLGGEGAELRRYDGGRFTVQRVVDGDTLIIEAADGDEAVTRVRLWGIDTPELARAGKAAEPYAEEAAALAREMVEGRPVILRLEPHRVRGGFGRVLAHVTLPDGRSLNEALLAAGLARVDDRWPHRWLERYALIERQARQDGRGLWAKSGEGSRPRAGLADAGLGVASGWMMFQPRRLMRDMHWARGWSVICWRQPAILPMASQGRAGRL